IRGDRETARSGTCRTTPKRRRRAVIGYTTTRTRPYQRQLHAYVQTPQYKATDRELRVAVALSKAHDAALLCAARKLLTRRTDGKLPPRRLPQPRILPGGYVPQWWMNSINATDAGIWRAIPPTGPELRLGDPDDPLVQEVAKQARLLQASRVVSLVVV
ncbi:hypothetical protein ABT187_49505, partial [Streptomyces sp. NPDC001817]